MFRWIFLFLIIAGLILVGVIYLDSQDKNHQDYNHSSTVQRPSPVAGSGFLSHDQDSESFFDFHTHIDIENPEQIERRIDEIEMRLQEIGHNEQAVPFYGELNLLYRQIGRFDAAAEAVRHIGLIHGEASDWWESAILFYSWAVTLSDTDEAVFYLNHSKEAFEIAIEQVEIPGLLTDYAILLYSMGDIDSALSFLERASAHENPIFLSFLYSGVILNEKGKIDESISYINKSLDLADTPEETSFIFSVLAEASIEILN
jgi:tetratricopeptide (TPR) repeat protein